MSKRKRIARIVPVQDNRNLRIKEMRDQLGYHEPKTLNDHWIALQTMWHKHEPKLNTI